MANVILINANTTVEPYPVYPLGMSLVASSARAQGHRVSEWDLLFNEKSITALQNHLQTFKPDVIGVSIRNVDTVNYNKQDAYTSAYTDIIHNIKQFSTAPVVLGGSAFTIFPQQLLDVTGADYGITGKGETAFCRLLDQLENGWPPAGKLINGNTAEAAPDTSLPSRDEQLAEFYLTRGGMLNVQTKRGCPHRCAYCSYPHLEGKRYQFRPARDVADEIQMLIEKYQCNYYAITDSVFNDAAGKYLQIAEELVRRHISTPWMCFMRPQNFNAYEVDLLKKSGLSSVEWGTDSSSDITLNGMRKDFTWDQVWHANKIFADAGIANAHFIIFGGPDETEASFREGLNNIAALPESVVFGSLGIRIFPHTPIFSRALDEAYISADQDLLQPTYYFSKDVDIDQMHRGILDSFAGRQDRIYPDGQFVEKTSALHMFGHRGPAWDFLLKKNPARRRRM